MAKRVDNISPNSLKSQPFMRNLLKSFKSTTLHAIESSNPVLNDIYKNNEDYIKFPSKKDDISEVEKEPILKKAKEYLNRNIEDIKTGEINRKSNKTNPINNSGNNFVGNRYSFMDDVVGQSSSNAANEYNSEFTQNIVVNTNINSRAIIHTIHDVVGAISRSHLQGTSVIALHVNRLNQFNNDVTTSYYNDISNYANTMNNALKNISDNLQKQANLRKVSLNAESYSFELDTVLETQKLLSLEYLSKELVKGINDTLMIGKNEAKMMIDTIVSNPIGFLIKEFNLVGRLIPSDIRKSLESFNGNVGRISDSLILNFKEMQSSKNPFLRKVGDLFGPSKNVSKVELGSYTKGKVAYDGITKRAIVNVIPTLLSKILRQVDPKNYPDELVYDYDKGGFVNKSDMVKYMKQYDNINDKPTSIEDAKRLKDLIKSYINDKNRFSDNHKYGIEYASYESRSDSNKEINKLKDFFKRQKELGINDDDIKSSNKIVKFISDNIDNGSNWIDKFFFGTTSLSKSADNVINNVFGFVDKNVNKDSGKVDSKGLFKSLKEDYFNPGINWIKDNYVKFKEFVNTNIWNPVKNIAKDLKDDVIKRLKNSKYNNDGLLGQALDEGVFKGLKELSNRVIKKPLIEKWKNFKTMMGNKLASKLANITKLLKDTTEKIRNQRTLPQPSSKVNELIEDNVEGHTIISNNTLSSNDKDSSFSENIVPFGPNEEPVSKSFKSVIKSLTGVKVRINRVSNVIDKSNSDIVDTYKIMRVNYKNAKNIDITLSKFYKAFLISNNIDDNENISEEAVKKDNFFKRVIMDWLDNTLKDIKFISKEIKIGDMFKKIFSSGIKAISNFTKGTVNVVNTTIKSVGTMAKGITILGVKSIEMILNGIGSIGQVTAPVLKRFFKESLPKSINILGEFLSTSIKKTGEVLNKASKRIIKFGGDIVMGTMAVASWGVSKIAGGIRKIFGKEKRTILNEKPTVYANVISGHLDGIIQPIIIRNNKKKTIQDKWNEEDQDDKLDSDKVTENAKKAKSTIDGRIDGRNNRIRELASKVVNFGVSILSNLGFAFLGTGIGRMATSGIGSVISTVKNSRIGRFMSKHIGNGEKMNAMRVYIVGGSLDGGQSGDGGIVEDALDMITGGPSSNNSSGLKNILSRGKKLLSGKTGKILGGAAVAGVAMKGVSSLKNRNKNEEITTQSTNAGTRSMFQEFPNVTADEMVKMYRKYREDEDLSEKELYKRLNTDERVVFDSTKSMMKITAAETNGKSQASFGDMFKKFIKGFSLGGILGGAFGLLFNGAKALWNGIKSVGRGLMNFIKNPIQSIKNFGSSLWNKLFGKKDKKPSSSGSSGSSGGSSGGDISSSNVTGGNIEWPTGPMTLGDKIILYAKAFLGKIRYSQGQRHKINQQGDRADCSSYTNHVFSRTAGIDIGSTTAQQQDTGNRITSKSALKKGDLVFFYGNQGAGRNGIGHVGIYEGNGKYVHTGGPSSGYNDAKIGDLTNNSKFAWGQRVINADQKVDSVVKNPNTALTGITESVGSSPNQQSRATGRSVPSGGGDPAINDNSSKSSRVGDPPTDTKSNASAKSRVRSSGNESVKKSVTNTFMTNLSPSYYNAVDKKLNKNQNTNKDSNKRVKSTCTSSNCGTVKNTDYSSNWSGLRTIRRNRAHLYTMDDASNLLYSSMVDVLEELDKHTEVIKDKKVKVNLNEKGNVFIGDTSNDILGFDKVNDISNGTQLIASGI